MILEIGMKHTVETLVTPENTAAKAHILFTAQIKEMLQMGEHGVQRMIESQKRRVEIQTGKAPGGANTPEHFVGQIPCV